ELVASQKVFGRHADGITSQPHSGCPRWGKACFASGPVADAWRGWGSRTETGDEESHPRALSERVAHQPRFSRRPPHYEGPMPHGARLRAVRLPLPPWCPPALGDALPLVYLLS